MKIIGNFHILGGLQISTGILFILLLVLAPNPPPAVKWAWAFLVVVNLMIGVSNLYK